MQPGQLIDSRYRLEREIGTGGMGSVWLATDVTLDRQVAMKRAHAISTTGTDTTKLEVEADLATKVRHPNIVEVYGIVGTGEDQWLVMEYVPSRSLAEVIAEQGTLSVPRAIHYVRQIADALDAVHRAEVVHGDVKPANILVPDNGIAKLSDFGVSRQVWNAETLHTTGPVLGTPAYMAPELLDGKRPSPASDLFALGATLFTAVEGEPPYGSDGAPLSTMKRVIHNEMVPMHSAGPLAPLLASMLAAEPAERPTAAGASRLLRELGGTIDPIKKIGTEPASRRRRWLVPGSAVATVVVLVLIAWLVWPRFGGSASTTSAPPTSKTSGTAPNHGLVVANQALVRPVRPDERGGAREVRQRRRGSTRTSATSTGATCCSHTNNTTDGREGRLPGPGRPADRQELGRRAGGPDQPERLLAHPAARRRHPDRGGRRSPERPARPERHHRLLRHRRERNPLRARRARPLRRAAARGGRR